MQELLHNDGVDSDLVGKAQAGDREALDELIRRHQPWLLHIAQRMLWNRADAEDAAQEILIKAVTHLSEFEQRSGFRTWLYRIAANHLLDRCRSNKTFAGVARGLNEIEDSDIPDPNSMRLETALLVEEAKIACTVGILLCLEPRQRLAFIIGEILGMKDDAGSVVLGTTPANFRQILSRARRELYGFLKQYCGLVNEANPCRCARKAQGFIERGWVNPQHLQFVEGRVGVVGQVATDRFHELQDLEQRYAEVFRCQPVVTPQAQSAALRRLLRETGLEDSLELGSQG
ncbi:MAG TPA: RNA polymerase sigma factor [Bryobacteraceae bacterium]|nr:RNA polymerase sigma factor [Bryobacteraceae bacterium]